MPLNDLTGQNKRNKTENMITIYKWVHNHFGWLLEEHAFRETITDPNKVLLSGPKVSIEITYNPRDGCDFIVCRKGDEQSCFGITGLTAALATHRGHYKPVQNLEDLKDAKKIEAEIEQAAQFLKGEGKITLTGDKRLFNELSKLRFWHTGRWIHEWGKGIIMSEADIAKNRNLVPRIIGLLAQKTDQQ